MAQINGLNNPMLRNHSRVKSSPKRMGQTLQLEWQETASELKDRYRKERNSERKTRLHAFRQLRWEKP